MAQSRSCSNPDLSNQDIFCSSLVVCTDLDAQTGEEGEEVELAEEAEEVGEDALLFTEVGQNQTESQENGSRGKTETMAIWVIEVGQNRVTREVEEDSNIQEDSGAAQKEEADKEQEEIDLKTTKKEHGNMELKNECPLVSTEIRNEQISQHKEEKQNQKDVETCQGMEKIDEVWNYDVQFQESDVSAWDGTQLQTSEDTLEASEDVETNVTLVNAAINEQDNTQSYVTFHSNDTTESIDPAEGTINQTSQPTTELQAELRNSDSNNYHSVTPSSVSDDVLEEENSTHKITDATFASDEDPSENILEVASNQLVDQLELVTFAKQSLTDKWTEETVVKDINQKEREEENIQEIGVDFLKMTDMKEEDKQTVVLDQNIEILQEPAVHQVEKVSVDEEKVETFEMAEVFELKDPNQKVSEVPKENKSTAATEDNSQKHPLKVLKRLGTDWVGNLRRHQKQKRLSKKKGGREEEAMTGGVEMAEGPVTVLDDEIEAVPGKHIEEEIPDTNSSVKIEDKEEKEGQELQKQKDEDREFEKKNKENIKHNKHENKKEENDVNRGKTKVKELKQAMEDGSLALQPTGKEGLGKSKVLSSRRKDNAWIKKDQQEEAITQETKEWRKELRPVRKDIWENEKKSNERLKKEPLAGENTKEDWLKELKSVIKDESLPKRKDEQVKKKRVVLLEDGHSYIPQREEMAPVTREEVQLIPPSLPSTERRDSRTLRDQNYKISLYVKVRNH